MCLNDVSVFRLHIKLCGGTGEIMTCNTANTMYNFQRPGEICYELLLSEIFFKLCDKEKEFKKQHPHYNLIKETLLEKI